MAKTFAGRAEQDGRIEFRAMLDGVAHSIPLAGARAGDAHSSFIKKRRADGGRAEVDGENRFNSFKSEVLSFKRREPSATKLHQLKLHT